MEILHEGERPEARLRRLLGHISIYDSVERWRTEHADEILASEIAQRNATLLPSRAMKPACRISSVDSPLRLHTLAQFQAAIRMHLDEDKETMVPEEEEVFSDDECKEDIDVDPDDTVYDESDEETSWSEKDDPIMDFIEKGMDKMLQRDVGYEVVVYRSYGTALKSSGRQ
jgi:hypothetical protein